MSHIPDMASLWTVDCERMRHAKSATVEVKADVDYNHEGSRLERAHIPLKIPTHTRTKRPSFFW
jgi:hypothetical protein